MKNSAVKKKVKLPDTWLIVFGILLNEYLSKRRVAV